MHGPWVFACCVLAMPSVHAKHQVAKETAIRKDIKYLLHDGWRQMPCGLSRVGVPIVEGARSRATLDLLP